MLELDVDERKLSLGHKQTTKNPWDEYEKTYAVETNHELKIDSLTDDQRSFSIRSKKTHGKGRRFNVKKG